MSENDFYSHVLGSLVLNARENANMTQEEVGEIVGIHQRTILEIEKGRGNPKLDVLILLIKELGIDPVALFYPTNGDTPLKDQLMQEVSTCSEEEAELILASCHAVLTAMRKKKKTK